MNGHDDHFKARELREVIESSPSGLIVTGSDGKIVLVNREAERLFGYSREELAGQPIEMLVPEQFRSVHSHFRAGYLGHPRRRPMGTGRDLFGLRKDGTEFPVEIGLNPVETEGGVMVVSSIVDISSRKNAERERKLLEAELLQSQKMEAVGRLSGGIAHDFNNILGAIIGFAELARDSDDPAEHEKDLHEILVAATRGKAVIERLLRFSRRQEISRKPVDLGHTVADSVRLLRPTLPAGLDIRTDFQERLPPVSADIVSVQQIIMNLTTNAAHAMPSGGKLTFTLEDFYARDSYVRTHAGLHEGRYVLLAVRDTGTGMDEATRARAFDPFFTTKATGQGSGLGLTMVHNTMHSHDGIVWIESAPGEGTTVKCLFPALETQTVEEPDKPRPLARGKGERILFVDDEVTLTVIAKRRLDGLGYIVKTFNDPQPALSMFQSAPQDFDLLITDYSMPHMSGLDLAHEITALRPDIPVLLLTGYMEDFAPEEIARAGVRLVVKKPIAQADLAAAIHSLLESSTPVAAVHASD